MRCLFWLLLTGWVMAQEHLLKVPTWLPTEVQAWQVSSDAQRILTLPAEHQQSPLELWDATRGQRLATLLGPLYHVSARFLPDGKVAALSESISDSGVSSLCAWVWDRQGKILLRQPGLGGDFAQQEKLLAPDTLILYHWQNQEAGDANGRLLWSEGQVQSWHWPSRKVRTLVGVRARLRQVALSPDASWLLTLGGDDMLGIWRPHTGQLVAKRFRTDRFQCLPGQVVSGDLVLHLPTLKKARSWDGAEVVSAGKNVFKLSGERPTLLQAQSLQPRAPILVQCSAGFSISESQLVGKLSDGRLVLWDAGHQAVGITR